jgi:outer membrane immunogenic protein
MKKIVLAAAAIMVVAGSASAADMPVKYTPPVKVCPADWFRGGYIGVNGGFANWTANRTDQDEVLVDTATYVQKKWGGVIGGQIGYNWTTCNTLWGIEIDGDWAFSRHNTLQLIPNAPFFNINIESRFDALLTARTRYGIVLDNLLLYVTGGVAAGHFRTTYTNQFLGIAGVIPGFTASVENSEWRWGLVAGIGAEWAWSDRVSIRSEVLYVDFVDRENRFLFAPPATFANFTESDSIWVSRIALNVKFGDYPVAAKY